MKVHRPITKLALACLLFLGVALGDTPALAAQRAEALPHTLSVPELTVASGPSSPEEMEAFLDVFFEAKLAELHQQCAQTTQRIQQEHDNLHRADSAQDLTRRIGYLGQRQRQAEEQAQQVSQARNQLSFLRVREEEKQQELVEKVAAVRIQERLKEKAKKEHDVQQAKSQEDERDDTSIQLWNRRSKSTGPGA